MKNKIKLICVFFLSFLFVSCVDYVQSISYKNGIYHLYYKITLSKSLLEMADTDPEEYFDDFEKEMRDLPSNVKMNKVDTDLEIGTEFSLNINPKTTDKDEQAFLPKVAGTKCFIPFLLGFEEVSLAEEFSSGDSESEAITKGILSSAKCRVMIDKNILPDFETAYFEGTGGQNCSIPIFDYGSSYCLEIPFIVLLDEGMYRFDRIVILRKQ